MLLTLAEHLDIPLCDRNQLLLAGGYAPRYSQNSLNGERLARVRTIVQTVLNAHNPNPALAVDRRWNLVEANDSATALFHDVDSALLEPPINVLRVALHPHGLAPRIMNFAEWRSHLLHRLSKEIAASGNDDLRALRRELSSYCYDRCIDDVEPSEIAVPLRLRTANGERAYLSTVTTFGTPLDITVEELVIECFYPL